MVKLIFGDEKLFSVNIFHDGKTLTELKSKDFIGVSFSLRNEKIGDTDSGDLFDTFVALLENKIKYYDYSFAQELTSLKKNEIYYIVVNGYEKAKKWEKIKKRASVWLTLDLSPCLDGDVVILLLTEPYDRIIWRKFGDESIKESILPAGYVADKIKMLVSYFNNNISIQKRNT